MRVPRVVDFSGKTPFSVTVIPTLIDNYSYLVTDTYTGCTMAVDPVEPLKVAHLISKQMTLASIATTHHHSDHSAGNAELLKMHPQAKVYGFDERIPAITDRLADGGYFSLGKLRIEAIHCPCHTSGSISFVVHDDEEVPTEQAVFTGDTLFLGGCGRFFEGTAAEMYEALYLKIGRLSKATKIFVGHEYTLKNLEFAHSIEPSNAKLVSRLQSLRKAIASDPSYISVPGTLKEEWETNPFMRLESAEVKSKTSTGHQVATMEALRNMKNNF